MDYGNNLKPIRRKVKMPNGLEVDEVFFKGPLTDKQIVEKSKMLNIHPSDFSKIYGELNYNIKTK